MDKMTISLYLLGISLTILIGLWWSRPKGKDKDTVKRLEQAINRQLSHTRSSRLYKSQNITSLTKEPEPGSFYKDEVVVRKSQSLQDVVKALSEKELIGNYGVEALSYAPWVFEENPRDTTGKTLIAAQYILRK